MQSLIKRNTNVKARTQSYTQKQIRKFVLTRLGLNSNITISSSKITSGAVHLTKAKPKVESIESLQRRLTSNKRMEHLEKRLTTDDFKMKMAYAEMKEEKGGYIFAKKERGLKLTSEEERILTAPSIKEVHKQIRTKPKKNNKGFVPQLTAKAKGTGGIKPLKYQDPTGLGRSNY